MLGINKIVFHSVLLILFFITIINVVLTAEIRVKKILVPASTVSSTESHKKEIKSSSGRSNNDNNNGLSGSNSNNNIKHNVNKGNIGSEESLMLERDDQLLDDNIKEESHGVRGYDGNDEYDSPPSVHVYATSGGSGLNSLSVIALSVFGVLTLLLILQLLGVQTLRSMGSSTPSLFKLPFEWNFNSEIIPEIMTKAIDWIEKFEKINNNKYNTHLGNNGEEKRVKRDVTQTPSMSEWMTAYKKDPYEYECIRKLACETLAHSTLIANSMKSQLGSTIMSSFKYFFNDATILTETIKDVIEDPDKCFYLFSDYICDDPEPNSKTTSKKDNNHL